VRMYGHEDRTGAGDAARGVDTFRVVLGPFDGVTRAIVVYWFTSPVPSALRVSHSLSGLIPPELRGFVSRRIRP
jgi:hypothetical protein